MGSFLNLNVDAKRLAEAMEGIEQALYRVATAVERLAPPPQQLLNKPYKATLADLRHPDPSQTQAVADELRLFADNANVIFNSDRFIESVVEYEKQVAETYGEESILELPWNKAAGSHVFKGYKAQKSKPLGKDTAETSASQTSTDTEPTAYTSPL